MRLQNLIRKSKSEYDEYCLGYLIKAVDGAIVEIPFNYAEIGARKFTVTASAVSTGREFKLITETIYTSRIDLNFAEGDQVKLLGNRKLTIKDFEEVRDKKKALLGRNNLVGLFITFSGGVGR